MKDEATGRGDGEINSNHTVNNDWTALKVKGQLLVASDSCRRFSEVSDAFEWSRTILGTVKRLLMASDRKSLKYHSKSSYSDIPEQSKPQETVSIRPKPSKRHQRHVQLTLLDPQSTVTLKYPQNILQSHTLVGANTFQRAHDNLSTRIHMRGSLPQLSAPPPSLTPSFTSVLSTNSYRSLTSHLYAAAYNSIYEIWLNEDGTNDSSSPSETYLFLLSRINIM